MHKKTPAQDRAMAFLQDHMGKCRGRGTSRLPTVAKLAGMAHVAHGTMWRATHRLKHEGFLTAAPNRGISICPTSGEWKVQVQHKQARRALKQAWSRVYSHTQADILRGVYLPGSPLPAPKELMKRYGVCYRTLKKAIDELVLKEIIVPHKRGYLVPAAARSPHFGSVALIAGSDASGNLHLQLPRTIEHLRALESECSRIGVNLEIIPFDNWEGKLLASRMRADSPLGFMLWEIGMRSADMKNLVERLPRLGKPISLLDETGDSARSFSNRAGRAIKLFLMGFSPLAGRHVGRYLLGLGHRRIAYISPMHAAVWSQNRLEGVVHAFRTAGLREGVAAFTLDQFSSTQVAPRPLGQRVHAAITSVLSSGLPGTPSIGRDFGARLAEELEKPVMVSVNREAMRSILASLLERVLSRSDVTAWVASNDLVAVECSRFLGLHKVRVPQDISVVGFDDSVEASSYELTSYNFNGAAVIRAMLAHILNTGSTARQSAAEGPLEIEGSVVERGTTARARRSLS